MTRISRQLVNVVVVLILFQFLVPAFVSFLTTRTLPEDVLVYSEQHCSILMPALLKENNEKEVDEFSPETHLTPLLDLAVHTINLRYIHEEKRFVFFSSLRSERLAPLCTVLFVPDLKFVSYH